MNVSYVDATLIYKMTRHPNSENLKFTEKNIRIYRDHVDLLSVETRKACQLILKKLTIYYG